MPHDTGLCIRAESRIEPSAQAVSGGEQRCDDERRLAHMEEATKMHECGERGAAWPMGPAARVTARAAPAVPRPVNRRVARTRDLSPLGGLGAPIGP